MSRFQVPTIKERGQVAQAMAQVQQRLDPVKDVTGRIACTRCGGGLNFTIQRDGHQRGHCNCGMRWVT
jgi:hypothetical protein